MLRDTLRIFAVLVIVLLIIQHPELVVGFFELVVDTAYRLADGLASAISRLTGVAR